MDVATTHCPCNEPSGKKEGGKKRSLDDRIHLPEDKGRQRNTERGNHIPKEQGNRRREEGRCMRCGKKNHRASEFTVPATTKSPPPPSTANSNQEPINEKRKFDKGHLKITELGSEEDSGNE